MEHIKYVKVIAIGCFLILVPCFLYWVVKDVRAQKTGTRQVQTQQAQQVKSAQPPGAPAGLQEHFNKITAIAKNIKEAAAKVIYSISQKIMQLNYIDPATGSIVSKVEIKEGVFGVIFEFSPEQNSRGFVGMIMRPILGPFPAAMSLVKNVFHIDLVPLFDAVLLSPLALVTEGTIIRDQQTGRKLLRTGPFLEFIFKSALLLSNEAQGRLQPREYEKHLDLLIARLKLTPGFKTIDEIFKRIPAPFRSLLEIKVLNKSVKDILTEFLARDQEVDALVGAVDEPAKSEEQVFVPGPTDMPDDAVYKEFQLLDQKELQAAGLTPEECKELQKQMQEIAAPITGPDLPVATEVSPEPAPGAKAPPVTKEDEQMLSDLAKYLGEQEGVTQ